ncbi:MAG TPA: hypothetical protein VF152_02170 [Acidimicrobiia bacterium]
MMLLFRVLWWALRSRLTWFAAGAALMYFFDPDQGTARRARFGGQVQGLSDQLPGTGPGGAGIGETAAGAATVGETSV